MICSRLLTLCIQLKVEAILHNSFIHVRKHFSVNVVITWNNLPATSEHFSSFSQFKCFFNSVNLTSHVSLEF